MALKTDSHTDRPAPRPYAYRWLVRGERVHLSCGGDELPVEWHDGNELHQRDGGRWWTPERASALNRWTSAHERAIERIITAPAARERAIMIQVECAWDRRFRAGGVDALGQPLAVLPLPDPLPEATQAWITRQRSIADELAGLALDAFPRLAGDHPAWITLRKCVARDELWLSRAVQLGVMGPMPIVQGKPILPVIRQVRDDAERMRAAEELARDMVGGPA